MQEVLDNALKGRGTSNYDLEFTTKSNETRYLLVNATTRRDAENNIVGVVGVAQDVTETAQHDRGMCILEIFMLQYFKSVSSSPLSECFHPILVQPLLPWPESCVS